jgi:hypothetical protein
MKPGTITPVLPKLFPSLPKTAYQKVLFTQNRLSEIPFLLKTAYHKVLFTQNRLSESHFYPKPLIRKSFFTQNRLSESRFYPKPLIRKPFLPNVGKTLTAQKTYLTSEERSVKNRKQTICLMQCLYFKHL